MRNFHFCSFFFSLSERSESSTMRIMKSLLVMASPLIFCFFILLSTSAYYQRPSFSQRRLIQLPVLPFRFGGTSASSPFSFCFLESNSWEIRTKAIHFLIDPVLDTLDFGIPWLYSGKKRVLNGPEELSRLVKNHRQSSPFELSSEYIDFILISQGLDDHAHKPTLTRLQKLLPDLLYIIPPSAEKILLGCGINKKNMIILSHGQSFEKKKLGETLKIIATSGALVGPPWQEKENGYVIQSVNDKSSLSSFYYEPHGMFNPEELREYEGKIPIVISPIVSQEISISDAVPSYTLVVGNEQVIDLVEKLKPKYLIPMLNGDLNQAGLLASILKTTGSELEFEETLRKNTKIGQRTAFVRNIVPGKVFSL